MVGSNKLSVNNGNSTMAVSSDEVLKFWFEENGRDQWFGKEETFDEKIDRRFAVVAHRARDGRLERWVEAPRSCLALILLIDQFSRNLYRGSPLAWSADVHALAVAKLAIEKGYDAELNETERAFMYMPFMHSEDLDDQALGVKLFDKPGLENNYRFTRHHYGIVERFGRFPHRNKILGRESTDAEIEYLNSKQGFQG